MRYYYGTNDSYHIGAGRTASAKQIASIIKRDVEVGKWNKYEGGRENTREAHCRYAKKGYIFHSQLMIFGKQSEFKELEKLIAPFIDVTPRQFENQ